MKSVFKLAARRIDAAEAEITRLLAEYKRLRWWQIIAKIRTQVKLDKARAGLHKMDREWRILGY